MVKYNSFQYGAELYGVGAYTEDGDVIWVISVDWDNDGAYDGENEAGYCKSINIKRGRSNYASASGSGFEATRPGRATLIMDNKDRRYDPRNTGGALYPNILPGRKVKIYVVETADGTQHTLFTGWITDIIPLGGPLGTGSVRIECADWLQMLNDQKLTSTAAAINTTISDCFVSLLDDAGYPGAVTLDSDTQPVYVFAVNRQSAGQVAHDLASAALGNIFVDVNGAFKFYARNHSYGAATTLDQANCLNNITISQPWDEIFTYINVTCHKWVKEQPSIIYFLSNPIQFGALFAQYFYPEYPPSQDVAINKYESNTKIDGSGTDITSTTTITPSSVSMTRQTIKILDNTNSGYLINLEIRGRKWREETEVQSYQDDTDVYGQRSFYHDTPYLQDQAYLNSWVSILDGFFYVDREGIDVQIEQHADFQYDFELFEKVNFTSSTLDIDDNYWVLGIEHDWTRGAQGVTTSLVLRKIITNSSSITPKGFIEDQLQAPQGYDNPAGDEDTIEAVGEVEDIIMTQPCIQLTGATTDEMTFAAGSIIKWGDGEYANSKIETIDPDGMYNQTTSETNIVILTPGIWDCTMTAYYAPASSPQAYVYILCQIRLYDTDTTTLLNNSLGVSNQWDETTGETDLDVLSITDHVLFTAELNQVIKCRLSYLGGSAYVVFTAKKIRDLP